MDGSYGTIRVLGKQQTHFNFYFVKRIPDYLSSADYSCFVRGVMQKQVTMMYDVAETEY